MSQYTSYYTYQKYQRRGTGEWTPVSPSVYSIDGEGTMPLSIKNENDPACGYIPPVEPTYRWINMDISTNWICDDCPTPQYRTVSTAFTCVGYDKHYLNEYQVSYDSGVTWTTTATTTGDLIETNSTYCGYVPPTPPIPTGAKFFATYSGGTTYSAECDSNTTLTTATTKPSGYQHSAMTDAVIGDCITSIGFPSFSMFKSLTSVTISSGVTSIASYAFWEDSGLTSVDIPDSVTSIGAAAFQYCSGLTTVTIGSGLTSIGDAQTGDREGAFQYCSGLESITIKAVTPPTIIGTNNRAFIDTNNCPIYVPAESVNAYKTASENWSFYADRIFPIP